MNYFLKIEKQHEWEAIRKIPLQYFHETIALYLDNDLDRFLIDYEFIRSIAQSTKHHGFCDLHIKDVNRGMNDLNFLKDIPVAQIYIDSPDVSLVGAEHIKEFSSFVFLSKQGLDLSYLKPHQDRSMFSLAISGKSLINIESLSCFPDFEYLCLVGSISDCNVFKQFSSFKNKCRTELCLDDNLIENLGCFEEIFLSGLSLNQNKVKDISNLPTIIKHNLKKCDHFSLSLQNNPIGAKERLELMERDNIQRLIKDCSLILRI
ncbi:hypothetical protein [Faecalispora anaeroviscerum]|uniref:hypothetical protein n=1 Tax=Faecalispora anaeroviscerum TaxID=2991836 RepID=UPI0024B87EB3|nr:hypothetical protein [Faecalispora anaeroviscerum]